MNSSDEVDYKFVSSERMKCDYSLYRFEKQDALECIQRAEKFLGKVENLIR
jgi:uncharacterized protein (UPF0332 family)